MSLFAANVEPSSASPALAMVVLGLVVAGIAAWTAILRQLRRPESLVPLAPRRAVPWSAGHCAAIIFVYVASLILVPHLFLHFNGREEARQEPPVEESPAKSNDHMIVHLLRNVGHDPAAVLLGVLTAGLLAPLCEEFVFRLTLQGYLEARERRFRRRFRLRAIPRGLLPVTIVAIAFALLHVRRAARPPDLEVVRDLLMGTAVAHLLTILVGLAILRWDARATADDLGWSPQEWRKDLRTGLVAFFALATLLFPLQAALTALLPKDFAADPLSLIPFALVVGWLYFRTHRILPSIAVHITLNSVSLVLLWASTTSGS